MCHWYHHWNPREIAKMTLVLSMELFKEYPYVASSVINGESVTKSNRATQNKEKPDKPARLFLGIVASLANPIRSSWPESRFWRY